MKYGPTILTCGFVELAQFSEADHAGRGPVGAKCEDILTA